MDAESQSLEMQVIARVQRAVRSREAWEATYPDLGPLDEDHVALHNWASMVDRQGMVLADLAVFPRTKAELKAEMQGLVERAPSWLNAHIQGQALTLEVFLRGLAQTLAIQRTAIERVMAEQVVDAKSIRKRLAEAPVPAETHEEERGDLLRGVSKAITAHLKALADLAYDLETQVREMSRDEN